MADEAGEAGAKFLLDLIKPVEPESVETPNEVDFGKIVCLGKAKAEGQFFRLIQKQTNDINDELLGLKDINGRVVLVHHGAITLQKIRQDIPAASVILPLENIVPGQKLTIGQALDANIQIAYPNIRTSLYQARIWQDEEGQWFLETDPRASNPCCVNLNEVNIEKEVRADSSLVPVKKETIAPLAAGDRENEADSGSMPVIIESLDAKGKRVRYTYQKELTTSPAGREENEDYIGSLEFIIEDDPQKRILSLNAVLDGMGGHLFGEEASRIAWQAVARATKQIYWKDQFCWGKTAFGQPVLLGNNLEARTGEKIMDFFFQEANKAVYEWTEEQKAIGKIEKYQNAPRTTMVAALFVGDTAIIGNVGDSRAMNLTKENKLFRLTTDHTIPGAIVKLAEDQGKTDYYASVLEGNPYRNTLAKSLGHEKDIEADISRHVLLPDTSLILTTDGLFGKDEGIDVKYRRRDESYDLLAQVLAEKGLKGTIEQAARSKKTTDNCSMLGLRLVKIEVLE